MEWISVKVLNNLLCDSCGKNEFHVILSRDNKGRITEKLCGTCTREIIDTVKNAYETHKKIQEQTGK